jgi:phage shock protein PspC (stress-responsive transcriptional regulator)
VKIFGGVAGGLAQYFNIDPIIIRILFVVFTMMHGIGIVLYIILWIVTPEEPFEMAYPLKNEEQKTDGQTFEPSSLNFDSVPKEIKKSGSGRIIAGTILIALGIIFFADRFIPEFDFRDILPIAFVLLGGLLIWNSLTK